MKTIQNKSYTQDFKILYMYIYSTYILTNSFLTTGTRKKLKFKNVYL